MHLLHSKGLLTLFLISISEGVSVANTVTSRHNTHHTAYTTSSTTSSSSEHPKQNSATTNNDERECAAVGGDSQSCLAPTSMITSDTTTECLTKCCQTTSTDTPTALALCETLRGGHMHTHQSPSGSSLSTPYNIPLYAWKIIFQFVLTSINVICWLVPLKSKRISENEFALGIANAFSGGVFLSLAFGHLLPECVHGFEGYNEAMPYMCALGGYLLIFFVEKVAFDTHALLDHGHGGGGHHHHECATEEKPKGVVANGVTGGAVAETKEEAGGVSSGRSAVILLGALAVHSVLEMTALGLANTFADSALLSLSIALHQPAESIALLVAFLKSGMPHSQIITYLSIFSTMGPIGVALGMAVKNFATPIVDAIMLAVVAGTFIYVGATEVIPEEWEGGGENKWLKFWALMGGIGSVFGITQYTMSMGEHEH